MNAPQGGAFPLRIPEILRQLRRGIPAERYTRDYFLSEQCDGFHEFQEDQNSLRGRFPEYRGRARPHPLRPKRDNVDHENPEGV